MLFEKRTYHYHFISFFTVLLVNIFILKIPIQNIIWSIFFYKDPIFAMRFVSYNLQAFKVYMN